MLRAGKDNYQFQPHLRFEHYHLNNSINRITTTMNSNSAINIDSLEIIRCSVSSAIIRASPLNYLSATEHPFC